MTCICRSDADKLIEWTLWRKMRFNFIIIDFIFATLFAHTHSCTHFLSVPGKNINLQPITMFQCSHHTRDLLPTALDIFWRSLYIAQSLAVFLSLELYPLLMLFCQAELLIEWDVIEMERSLRAPECLIIITQLLTTPLINCTQTSPLFLAYLPIFSF